MAAVTKRSQARVAIKRKNFISLDTSMGSLGNSCFLSVTPLLPHFNLFLNKPSDWDLIYTGWMTTGWMTSGNQAIL